MARRERLDGSEAASWENLEGSLVARLKRWESIEVVRREVSGCIQRSEMQGTSTSRFYLFVFDHEKDGAGWAQDDLAWPQILEKSLVRPCASC